MDISRTPDLSKFQKHGDTVIKTLNDEWLSKEKRFTLRSYQIDAVLKTKAHFDTPSTNQMEAIIIAPTGSGKTAVVTLLPYVLKCTKVVILSPSLIITEQLAEAFGNKTKNDSTRKNCFYRKSNLLSTDGQLDEFLEHVNVIKSTDDVADMTSTNLVIVNAQKFGGTSSFSLTINDKTKDILNNVAEVFKPFSTIIVDEAHHYPPPTWKTIVDNFKDKQIIFLSATSTRNNQPILENQQITFEVNKDQLQGVTIRNLEFKELTFKDNTNKETRWSQVSEDISKILRQHNDCNPTVIHQAMVLVQYVSDAEELRKYIPDSTHVVSDKMTESNRSLFGDQKRQTMIVCGKLLEIYDNSNVSLCVILRNVSMKSRILFQQFIGRCMKMSSPDDKVVGTVLTYDCYKQRELWNRLDQAAGDEEHPVEEDD